MEELLKLTLAQSIRAFGIPGKFQSRNIRADGRGYAARKVERDGHTFRVFPSGAAYLDNGNGWRRVGAKMVRS